MKSEAVPARFRQELGCVLLSRRVEKERKKEKEKEKEKKVTTAPRSALVSTQTHHQGHDKGWPGVITNCCEQPPLPSHTSPPRNQHAISASSVSSASFASFASPPADYGYQSTSVPACQLSHSNHSNHSPSITRPPTLHYRSLHTDHPQSPHQVHHQVHQCALSCHPRFSPSLSRRICQSPQTVLQISTGGRARLPCPLHPERWKLGFLPPRP